MSTHDDAPAGRASAERVPVDRVPVDRVPAERVDCVQAVAQLAEFLDAEIDEERGDLIRQHLASCEHCLQEFDVVDHIKALVKRSCGEQAPLELHARIRARLVVARDKIV